MATNNTKFDFDAYNTAIKGANTGLKLFLGLQLIQNVVSSLEHFDNPLEAELRPIYMDLKAFRELYKKNAEELAKKKENPSERNAPIDNSTVITADTVQNMMKMMAEMQRAIAFQKEGKLVEAGNAEAGVEQIKQGALNAQDETATGTNG